MNRSGGGPGGERQKPTAALSAPADRRMATLRWINPTRGGIAKVRVCPTNE